MTGFYAFLRQDTIQHLDINTDTIPRLALINIPILSKVQLLFGVGFGSRIIGAFPSKIANQYIMLSGEGGPELGCPNVLTLPSSIHHPSYIATMTAKTFSAKVKSKVTTYNYPLLAHSNFGDTTEPLQIASIPPFLVYDSFKKNLDASEVPEQVLATDRDVGGQEITLHIHNFLLS